MGLGGFRWRPVLIVIAIILLWQSSKVWLNFTQEEYATQAQLQVDQVITSLDQAGDKGKQKVHVVVYYEALCPDSRSFFVKQLIPTNERISENLFIEFVPYGRATTIDIDHDYKFVCQHGPLECQANMVHACSLSVIKNPSVQLEYLSCMIRNNIEPINIMKSCAKKMNVDEDSILDCYNSPKGKELLAKYGEMTNAFKSKISFIPTISLDGNFDNQARILKNLLQQVCLLLKVTPDGCIP